ncbi:hypothetical protein MK805_01830 [Shimazuella sp. AN120528]|uniref:hypothetical protein n=1 Tax=Shimazuella soli TaxID=1892854 RepID=UPI001F11400A|nr:hypothetical protein [Shimazuella soli]MCH5583710.1 hypothetical protein [Shimazuella soli]
MSKRQTLLVGSLPFENEEAAMIQALETLGESLFSLPDGEIGEKSEAYPVGKRAAWVMSSIDICAADTENWEITKKSVRAENGFPNNYVNLDRLRPKHSPNRMKEHLNFRYHEYFQTSYPIFQKLREQKGLNDLKFQVGIPTGLGITFCMLSPINAFRYNKVFNSRIAYEVNEILNQAGEDVLVQIEIPAELALVYKLPKALVNIALNSIFDLVRQLNPIGKIGLHLCFGDLNNLPITHAKTLNKMVYFINQLIKKWPKTHELSYIHFPLAEAKTPPPLEKSYYEPLKQIQLPEEIRFIAGFVHEKRSIEELQQILSHIEEVRNQQVDVACSCGLGRRSTEVGTKLLELTQQLCSTDQ